jgi:DNA-directed RNA polymerase subunit M/transcription elongation factor TFIIS
MALRKIDNPENFRVNIRNKLSSILEDEKNSINLEKGIFNYALKEADLRKTIKKWDNKQFVQIYIDRLRSITINLKGSVLQNIKDGSIKAQDVAFMTHQEIAPEKWQTLIDAKSKRDANKFEVNMAAATDTFTCRKCKANQCTYYTMQTRSSDEATTVFVQCVPCGNRWKTS